MAGTKIRLISWNVRGLNDKIKRSLVLDHLKKLGADVMLLQETHLIGQRVRALRRHWIHPTLHAEYSTYSRGVAILFRKASLPSIEKTISDTYGRFLILKLTIASVPLIIVNVYSPPPGEIALLQLIMGKIASIGDYPTVWMGDFNAVPDPNLDRLRKAPGPDGLPIEWYKA
uniref:exodeoxyribonuclease III n=1 Tax=Xenopus tropicalis TaxID=8364 RepID=A0A803JIB4_XENTR